jgi:LmbE family N-acetylglucosaminyl deacetylase
MAIRQATCNLLDRALRGRLAPFLREDWTSSAVVVAPHPDDETLGCGGVVSKKLAAGAEVRFVFVTDGAASHEGRISGDALRRLRTQEAFEAVRRLGARADDVAFMHVPDGRAAAHIPEISAQMTGLLQAWRPESVYMAHRRDPPSDHLAVNIAVSAAICDYGRRLIVFEYPVWYWYHWPWVPLGGDLPGMWRMNVAQTARTAAGLLSLLRLNTMADVSDVAAAKRVALAAHRSQTERPAGQPDWPVLKDLGRGHFLARLLSDYEAFTRYEANA